MSFSISSWRGRPFDRARGSARGGLSQRELARRSGVPQAAISRIERDPRVAQNGDARSPPASLRQGRRADRPSPAGPGPKPDPRQAPPHDRRAGGSPSGSGRKRVRSIGRCAGERASVRPVDGVADAARARRPVRPDRWVRGSPSRLTGDHRRSRHLLRARRRQPRATGRRAPVARRSPPRRSARRAVPARCAHAARRRSLHVRHVGGRARHPRHAVGDEGSADLDANATDEVVDGLTVRVASIEDLIRMKRAAGRPKDLIALEWLAAVRDEARVAGRRVAPNPETENGALPRAGSQEGGRYRNRYRPSPGMCSTSPRPRGALGSAR